MNTPTNDKNVREIAEGIVEGDDNPTAALIVARAYLASRSAVLEPVLCDSATAVCSICQEPVERHRDIESVRSSARSQEPPLDMIEAAMAVEIDHVRMRRDDGRCVLGFENAQKVLRAVLAAAPVSATRRSIVEQIIRELDEEGRASVVVAWEKQSGEPTIRLWLEQWLRRAEGRGA